MKILFLLCSIILLFIILTIYFIFRKNGLYIKSKLDNNYYFVSDLPNRQEIADLLAQIKINIKILLNYMKEDKNKEYKQYIDRLDDKINKVIFTENTNNIYTSYSVNKGEELVICVRSRKSNKLHNINLIMYVVLHEISHIMCPEYGHGELFQKIFKYVLFKATQIGLYKKIDFIESPKEYCGIQIKTSII